MGGGFNLLGKASPITRVEGAGPVFFSGIFLLPPFSGFGLKTVIAAEAASAALVEVAAGCYSAVDLSSSLWHLPRP